MIARIVMFILITATSPAAALDETTAQLMAVERATLAAYIARNTAVLDRNFATEYVHTNLIGQREGKAQALAEFAPGGTFTLLGGFVDHGIASRYGNLAILRADVHWNGATYRQPQGNLIDISGTYSVTRVYILRAGRWQLASSHASRQVATTTS